MPDIDAKKIEELRGLLAKATPEPWELMPTRSGSSNYVVGISANPSIPSPDVIASPVYSDREGSEDASNMALIVAMRNALPALLDLASKTLASASDLLVDDVFGKVYAHCVIKYDPKAAKRVIREALTMPSKAETFYAVQELDIDGKYQWCLVEIRPQQRRVVENFGFGRDAESKAKVAMNKREFIESKSKLEDGREVSADAAPLASAREGEDSPAGILDVQRMLTIHQPTGWLARDIAIASARLQPQVSASGGEDAELCERLKVYSLAEDIMSSERRDFETAATRIRSLSAQLAEARREISDNNRHEAQLRALIDGLTKAKLAWREHATFAEAEASALRERVGVLEKALKPFADRASRYDPDDCDDKEPDWSTAAPSIRIGDLRRARTALEGRS